MEYSEFLEGKAFSHVAAGFECGELPYPLFVHQSPIVRWALKRGKAAIFADTGYGKTIMQLSWADQVAQHTNGPVLVLAPLAVADQTIDEGAKYGIQIEKANAGADFFGRGIFITNYEQLHKFDCDQFQGLVLDESSILKGMDGRKRKQITEFGAHIPYKLSCTATPSPNDFMELGTQAEFLGIMSQVEMLAMFFIHDGGDTAKWRLKGHGYKKFFEWLATWSVVVRSPEDLGFDGSAFKLPPIHYHSHVVETTPENALFVEPAQGLQDRNRARKESVDKRVQVAADIANGMEGQVLVWCHLNEESEKLTAAINGAVEVKGADKPEHKRLAAKWFTGHNVTVLNGRLTEKTTCHGSRNTRKQEGKNITKTETIGKRGLSNLETQNPEKNTCVNTQEKIEKNSGELLSSKQNITGKDASDTQTIKSTEINKSGKPQNISEQIQKKDLQIGSKSTESHQTNTGRCLNLREEGAQFADQKILDAQSESDCTLTTATDQEKLEGCYAQTATKGSENSKTIQRGLESPPDTSRMVLVSKPKIFGYGLNFQNCHQIVFVGLSDSWESYYQAIRRCWRYGQKKEVHVHIVSADTEGAVVENIIRKDKQNAELGKQMVEHMKTMMEKEIFSAAVEKTEYNAKQAMEVPSWLV